MLVSELICKLEQYPGNAIVEVSVDHYSSECTEVTYDEKNNYVSLS